jgi:prepilin-type N-terminal cleavage/methylation domain-containing protein
LPAERTPSSSARRDSEAGFTLAELLVALGVLSLGAGLLATTLHTAALTSPAVAQPAGEDSVAAAQRILRDRLERLAPLNRINAPAGLVDARGDAHRFSFAAPPLDRRGPGMAERFRLMLSPNGDLLIYSAPSLDSRINLSDPSLVGWQPTRLLSGVQDIDIAYFGNDPITGEDRWQSFWEDRPRPPVLVRVRVRFVPGDRRQWPDLIARPQATVAATCQVDRATGGCIAP